MSRRKKAGEVSTITRSKTIAYARKQKPDAADDDDDAASEKPAAKAETKAEAKAETKAAPPDRPTMPLDPSMLKDFAADEPTRARVDTASLPVAFGQPPEMPEPPAAGVIKGGAVEDPTHMPGPREIPPGNPDDVASPPGRVPPGDSRSLRRRGDQYEFALVYRVTNAVISRVGIVGTRGVWRVVEYPTVASAANAYAREASRFVTDGFSDYRE